MSLIELYDSLEFPEAGNYKTFNAVPIPENPNFRIAINVEGNPVLLLSVTNNVKAGVLKNFRLKYFRLEQNIECKITENGKSSFQTFTVITFTSENRNLQEYFLRISETLIRSLSNKPSQQQVIYSLNKFIEVFRSLTDTPTNTVHGLWTELFLIEYSKNPSVLLTYWHNIPEEKFDFNAGSEKIEVKSNANFERIHTFSSEQLTQPDGTQVLIASIFIRQHTNGQSIQQLVESISKKIQNDTDLTEKLNGIVFRTLGNSLEQSIKIKFDYNIAKDSLRFYRHQDIKKIEKIYIPNEVTDVKFRSDLSFVKEFRIKNIQSSSLLFKYV
ncbi:MAG TPA: PD-(D/E)XK motif protein [Lacibacter sp.]|nr:PD-(D/E)XK motif protein [Lacibacter sp.]HMO88326.1 PD-(D/E)XK motif protein [Lacibacter sp.]HMP85764.1 PD-(D/E)XK motif protein [Lacibacter sp.]